MSANNDLIEASKKGDVAGIQAALKKGADLEFRDEVSAISDSLSMCIESSERAFEHRGWSEEAGGEKEKRKKNGVDWLLSFPPFFLGHPKLVQELSLEREMLDF